MVEDWQITPHFRMYDLTATKLHGDLQEENRDISKAIQSKIVKTAQLLEDVWDIAGPFGVSSAYRCPILNRRVGGSPNSQHLRGEAADFVPWALAIESTFDRLVKAATAKYFSFGQLIVEETGTSREGHMVWIHVSLGAPWRAPEKCGQIMRMTNGKYELIAQVGR